MQLATGRRKEKSYYWLRNQEMMGMGKEDEGTSAFLLFCLFLPSFVVCFFFHYYYYCYYYYHYYFLFLSLTRSTITDSGISHNTNPSANYKQT